MAERKSLVLRIDPALWAEIEHWAQDELRSVNGQIEYLLKQAVVSRRRKLTQEQSDELNRREPGKPPA